MSKGCKISVVPKIEFNIDFIHQEVHFCMHKDTFLKAKL